MRLSRPRRNRMPAPTDRPIPTITVGLPRIDPIPAQPAPFGTSFGEGGGTTVSTAPVVPTVFSTREVVPAKGGGATTEKRRQRDRGPPKPPPPVEHIITDSQLQMFLDASRDGFSDRVTLFVGIGVGLLPTCLESLYAAYCGTPPVPLNGLHIAELVATGMALAAAAAIHWAAGRKMGAPQALAKELRDRHRRDGRGDADPH